MQPVVCVRTVQAAESAGLVVLDAVIQRDVSPGGCSAMASAVRMFDLETEDSRALGGLGGDNLQG